MPTIYELAQQFREQLLKREKTQSEQVLAAFETVLSNLEPKIKSLESEMENDSEMSASKLFNLERYRALIEQTKAEIARFSGKAAAITSNGQRTNAINGFKESAAMIRAGTDSFVKLPARAISSFVGFASDGSPLEKVFNEISGGAAQKVKEKLTVGIALGHNPKKISSEIRQSFGTSAHRALAISRTESLRAHREASRSVYEENKNLVSGWIWLSARNTRTCAVCFAMDGTHHKTDEPLASHPCCRCSMLPDLGKLLPKTGAEVFGELPNEKQIAILGKSKFELFADGKIKLSDLVETRNDARWGKVRSEKSLRDL